MAKYCLINHSLARVESLKKIINNPVARIRWMPRNIFAVFRVPDEVISDMSVEMFSLFIRYVTLLPSYTPLYVLNYDVLVMVMMMMMISLISYFPFRDQLRLDLSKWLVYTCHSFPLHPSLVLSTIPKQQMTNQRVLHSVWRHFFLRNNQTLVNPKSAFNRSFSEKKNRYYCRSYSDRDFEATLEWFTHLEALYASHGFRCYSYSSA